MPQDTQFFSNHANCYAYAAKCANPINAAGGGQARPGGVNPDGTLMGYHHNLCNGVLADAGAGQAQLLGQFAVAALTAAQIPAARNGWYLIAMLSNTAGFHFVRRQRSSFFGTPFWKWKQGNHGLVERNAFHNNAWVRVTDALFPALVQNLMVTSVPGYGGWSRIAFFEVDYAGFQVTAA